MARGKWLSDAERARILQLQRDGLSFAAIAARVGRSYTSVLRHLRAKGPRSGGRRRTNSKQQQRNEPAQAALNQPEEQLSDGLAASLVDPGEPLVVGASLLAPERLEAAFESSNDAGKECDKDACEPFPFIPPAWSTAGTPPHSLCLWSPCVDQASVAQTVTPTEASAPNMAWTTPESLEEAAAAVAAPRCGLEPATDLAGLHATLQDELQRLSCQRSIGLVDAQLLQLLAKFQVDVLLLARQRESSTVDSQHKAELDFQADLGNKTQTFAPPPWTPGDGLR